VSTSALHTISSLRAWQTCRRLYKHKYVDLVRPAKAPRPFAIGSAVHGGLEMFAHGLGLEAMLAPCDNLEDPLDKHRARAMLRAYFARWEADRDSWEVVDVEGKLETVKLGVSLFTGRSDAAMRWRPTGKLYLQEHKTTSDDVETVGDDYWQRLALDTQVTLYREELERRTGEPVAILYDVLKKPGGKPKLKEAIRRRKDETDEQHEARKEAARETWQEFEDRLVAEMLAAPDEYLVRREVHRTSEQTAEILAELAEVARDIDTYSGVYPRNDSACSARYGSCPFLGVCSGAQQLDDPKFTRLATPHPELADNKEDPHGRISEPSEQCPV
jgi:hypothetical protein